MKDTSVLVTNFYSDKVIEALWIVANLMENKSMQYSSGGIIIDELPNGDIITKSDLVIKRSY